ncbi:MAG TPA: glycosyltransferase family 39 protein, partial [Armatimonadota bacterium]|nr:glycosyltransferase family 39 protein [Armatimonadota bacterium]
VILLVSAALGLAYTRATPVGENPDEGAHLQYIRVLATEHRLPQLDLTRRREVTRDVNYEAHQAPLYYALAVPFFQAGQALAGEAGAGQGPRLLSILIGLAGTALVWLLAREVAPERPALWGAAAAFAAFLPMRLAVNASVSNDALAEATASLALLVMVRMVKGAGSNRQATWLGAALGLALLSKSNAILLLPPALLALYLGARRGPESPAQVWRRLLTTGGVTAGVLLLLAGWWFARNQALYGDPLGQKAFNWYFADTPTLEQFRQAGYSFDRYLFKLVYPTAFASFWGAFGHLDPRRPELFMGATGPGYPPQSWVYPILGWVTIAALAGGVVYLIRSRLERSAREEEEPPSGLAVMGLHALFVVAAFLNFNSTYFQAQGRYLFPAMAFLSLALAGGLLEWPRLLPAAPEGKGPGPRRRGEWAGAAVIAGGMLALALYALLGVIQPAFGT